MARGTAGYAIREVTDALNQPAVLKKYLQFPTTPEEREQLIAK